MIGKNISFINENAPLKKSCRFANIHKDYGHKFLQLIFNEFSNNEFEDRTIWNLMEFGKYLPKFN